MTKEEKSISDNIALSVAIGHEVVKFLALKLKQSRIQTTWGSKSIEGIGACIQRIVEEQTERLK